MSDEVWPAGVPGGMVLAARLAERLAPGLAAATAARLLASPRLGARALRWAAEGAEDAVHALGFDDRLLAESGPDGLRRVASLAGAIWNAGRVRGLILARDLQNFLDLYGPEARALALRHAALAPPPGAASGAGAEAGSDAETDTSGLPLTEAVAADGRACLSAWLDALPPTAAAAVRLYLPPDDEGRPGPAHREHGPRILRAAAGAA